MGVQNSDELMISRMGIVGKTTIQEVESFNESSRRTFETINKNLKALPSTFTFNNNVLQSITYDNNGNDIVKTFSYEDDVLSSITLSGDIPDNIPTIKSFTFLDGNLTNITYS